MSTNGNSPKRRISKKLIPLLMLGSDGEVYGCARAGALPKGVLQNKHTFVAVRLSHPQRSRALKALQVGVVAACEKLTARKLDS